MKFIHVSDLHLGKTIYGVSLIDSDDQSYWVDCFLERVKEISPDAVLIAGDVYDRSVPAGDAVLLFDHMLTGLAAMKIPVLMIAGNHDSGERLSFASEFLAKSQVYISGTLQKKLTSVTLPSKDGGEEVTFWLMPYVFPVLVNHVLEDDSIHDYDVAVRRLLAEQEIDFSKKNVLIAHQNVTAFGKEVERGGSESMVGGVGQIDYTAFDGFTYVALGHIHSAYHVGREEVRYAGSPLYYHFDELRQPAKGPLVVEIAEDGRVTTSVEIIRPLHPMRELKGSYQEIKEDLEQNPVQKEYLRIVITDQRISPEISGYLRSLCEARESSLMELISQAQEFTSVTGGISRREAEEKSIEELFTMFYSDRRGGEEPDEAEQAILHEAGEILRNSVEDKAKEPGEKAISRLLDFVLKQEA